MIELFLPWDNVKLNLIVIWENIGIRKKIQIWFDVYELLSKWDVINFFWKISFPIGYTRANDKTNYGKINWIWIENDLDSGFYYFRSLSYDSLSFPLFVWQCYCWINISLKTLETYQSNEDPVRCKNWLLLQMTSKQIHFFVIGCGVFHCFVCGGLFWVRILLNLLFIESWDRFGFALS